MYLINLILGGKARGFYLLAGLLLSFSVVWYALQSEKRQSARLTRQINALQQQANLLVNQQAKFLKTAEVLTTRDTERAQIDRRLARELKGIANAQSECLDRALDFSIDELRQQTDAAD